MFKKNSRYATRGINEKIDIRLQLIMWSLIDDLKDKGNIEIDYLQVFKVSKESNVIVIEHSQEVPKYKNKYSLEVEDIQIDREVKIYVIDSGEYSTMLLPEEY